MVMKRDYLIGVIENAAAHGQSSFLHDVIMPNVGRANYMVYEYDGFYAHIGSMAGYFECSMKLLESDARERLFGIKNRPVLTKVRNSAPTRYCEGAKVTNSVVAEGCVIEGVVENSIIFRGVKVGKGAVVKNSILFQDTYVCDGAQLNCVITDKNVMIKDGRMLSGHETMPFYIGKNMSV
jgi:glucose-1-phosphate adenylyltransferase